MFDFLKPGKGFALTLNDGRRVEVDFGPMSRSEKINSTQRECDNSPASRNAEIRIYMPGRTQPSERYDHVTPDQFAVMLGNMKTEQVE